MKFRRADVVVGLISLLPFARARAQADEIQVYTGELAGHHESSLTVHANYTPRGLTTAGIPGGVVPQGSVNGAFEWAYGVTDWFEAGLYLPVYSITRDGSVLLDGGKLRALFAVPHAELRSFFYGVNFEYSRNAKAWDTSRYSAEIRPIVGVRRGSWDVIVNPILDTSFDGLGSLVFAPSLRVANNITPEWAVVLEQYSEFGQLNGFAPRGQQPQSLFAVTDVSRGTFSVEFGVGYGFTDASDRLVLKTILARSF
ncbi:hypothetical protein BH09GEM1_BH09GEM1_28010 [soil metagenome]